MKDALTTNDLPESPREPGYVLHVSDRTAAAMQLAAHFTAQSMVLSATVDPRARLAEQLSYFDLAFRADHEQHRADDDQDPGARAPTVRSTVVA